MIESTANYFRQHLKSQIDECITSHDVLRVKRRHGENFVVLGESDWKAIEETLYLNQFPGLVQSIHEAAQEALEEGTPFEELAW